MAVHIAMSEYLRRRLALWERRRTERYIRNLPAEVQKDIGWPDGGRRRSRPPREAGSLWERR